MNCQVQVCRNVVMLLACLTSCDLQQRLRPGLAMSQDGRNWARIEGEHHTGALFDVGKAGEWDETFIAGPQVPYCFLPFQVEQS